MPIRSKHKSPRWPGKELAKVFWENFRRQASLGTQIKIRQPKHWTAETPNLYRVEVRLKQNGKVIHQIQQRFGFRTMEVRDGDGLYVNGQQRDFERRGPPFVLAGFRSLLERGRASPRHRNDEGHEHERRPHVALSAGRTVSRSVRRTWAFTFSMNSPAGTITTTPKSARSSSSEMVARDVNHPSHFFLGQRQRRRLQHEPRQPFRRI